MRSFLTQQMLNTFQGMSKRERDEAISTLICFVNTPKNQSTTQPDCWLSFLRLVKPKLNFSQISVRITTRQLNGS